MHMCVCVLQGEAGEVEGASADHPSQRTERGVALQLCVAYLDRPLHSCQELESEGGQK